MKIETFGKINMINGDCMDYLRTLPDNAFSLAVCDPPYAIGLGKKTCIYDGKVHGASLAKRSNYHVSWDDLPPPFEYFSELKRVSRNQIIWGANHFIENVPNANSSCWIVWDKDNGENDFADCELAWTSFNSAVRKFKWRWAGMLQEDMKNKQKRIHPTEKPIALYAWLLNNYAKDGDTILDTHGGSGSICIAAHDLGFETTWIELDKQYYEAAKKRLIEHQKQLRLF